MRTAIVSTYPPRACGIGTFAADVRNFLPEYKILHDAGYNLLPYDLRNHGRSGMGSGGIIGHGVLSTATRRSLHYAKSRIDTWATAVRTSAGDMEHFWSRAGATAGNRSQIGHPRKGRN